MSTEPLRFPTDPTAVPLREHEDAMWAEHQRQHEMLAKALEGSTETMNTRLASMNEFRAQMKDQMGAFVSRDVFEVRMDALENARARESGMWAVVAVVGSLVVSIVVPLILHWMIG